MLVLTRGSQESVVVEGFDNMECMLKITVLQIRGDVVRLGFEAPARLAVHREEVWERIRTGGCTGSELHRRNGIGSGSGDHAIT